jgi:hypothetical protein
MSARAAVGSFRTLREVGAIRLLASVQRSNPGMAYPWSDVRFEIRACPTKPTKEFGCG